MALSCGNLAVAKSTGAVARPSCRSAAAGLPGYPGVLFKETLSRDGYFFKGLNILILGASLEPESANFFAWKCFICLENFPLPYCIHPRFLTLVWCAKNLSYFLMDSAPSPLTPIVWARLSHITSFKEYGWHACDFGHLILLLPFLIHHRALLP